MLNATILVAAVLGLALAGFVWRSYTAQTTAGTPATDGGFLPESAGTETGAETEAKVGGITRWLTTTDHRDIGIMYIVFGTIAAIWGGVDAMMIRTELLTPQADVWTAGTYDALFTTHGLTMLILFVTPVFFGIANYFLPLLIGADDLAFPRINLLGFWMLPPALVLIRGGLIVSMTAKFLGLFVPLDAIDFLFAIQPPEIGWYMYAPLSLQSANPQVDFMLLGLHLSGIATVLASVNFIITVFTEKSDEVSWADLDLFTWTLVTTAGIALLAFSVLGSALIMLLLDRNFGTTFFALEQGGAILWQHIFWFWGHPEVYIIVLPGFGLMSLILPKFSGRTLFGRRFVIYSTFAIGVLSFGVWAHHMFTTGIDPRIRASFMAVSLAIAIPSAIKEFNWITTIWKGRVRLTAPMLFCVGGLSTFVIGGITGVFLAAIPIDILYHDTYYVVGHFHMILMGVIPFMMMAASYYWFPIITGKMYNQPLARFQAVTMVIGVLVTFGAMLITGALGLPRRYATYPAEFTGLMEVTTIGAYVIGISVLLWLYNMLRSYWAGERVTEADVWDLKETGQFTREWQWFEKQLAERYATDGGSAETDTDEAPRTDG
ncbi:cytochrome c oxidase subunit I [Halococcus hamelinensis]|uniref:Cytochrome c oxidase subunit I n=1 Tax=Halococcus hamelinensis 100A6 TaxID=1132509 RepID=M0LXF8_9EURY|nr:cbb3-type cytochrome c oxidase subunit I [Halococcus hamelinensis]EMA38131.1 cytochrome c oxidase subunit I [Halococcus hamelinensis 100A6]